MTVWRYGKITLGLLLLLSLSLKLLGRFDHEPAPDNNPTNQIVAFLKQYGFEAGAVTSDVDLFSITAELKDCELLVAILSPQGWHRDVIRKLASPGSRLLFLYKGEVYDDQPVLMTRFDDYLGRMLRAAYLGTGSSPVIGVVASPECASHDVPWTELSNAVS